MFNHSSPQLQSLLAFSSPHQSKVLETAPFSWSTWHSWPFIVIATADERHRAQGLRWVQTKWGASWRHADRSVVLVTGIDVGLGKSWWVNRGEHALVWGCARNGSSWLFIMENTDYITVIVIIKWDHVPKIGTDVVFLGKGQCFHGSSQEPISKDSRRTPVVELLCLMSMGTWIIRNMVIITLWGDLFGLNHIPLTPVASPTIMMTVFCELGSTNAAPQLAGYLRIRLGKSTSGPNADFNQQFSGTTSWCCELFEHQKCMGTVVITAWWF